MSAVRRRFELALAARLKAATAAISFSMPRMLSARRRL
jgi:hypothetical protein